MQLTRLNDNAKNACTICIYALGGTSTMGEETEGNDRS